LLTTALLSNNRKNFETSQLKFNFFLGSENSYALNIYEGSHLRCFTGPGVLSWNWIIREWFCRL